MTAQSARLRYRKGAMLLAALALLLAACGGGGETSETASAQSDVVPIAPADGATTTASPGATTDAAAAPAADSSVADEGAATGGQTFTIAEAQDAYRSYVTCMKDEGVPVGPAVFDADGKIDIDAELAYWESLSAADIAGLEDETIDYDAIDMSCRPENAESLYALIAPDESRVQELENEFADEFNDQMTELARCMRRTFPEFPDPILPDLSNLESDIDVDPFPGIDPDDPIYFEPFEQCALEIGLEIGPNPGGES